MCTDLLGMNLSFHPKFVKRYAQLEGTIVDAFKAYADEVRSGAFPSVEQSFTRKTPRAIPKIYG